jgi:diacylglycerol kinase (ATP)
LNSGENQQQLNIYAVVNPVAGNANSADVERMLREHFKDNNHQYEVYETSAEDDVATLTRSAVAKGANLVIAAGGDGTVAGVINGLVFTGIPLGIIPIGTGNGLARALKIPLEPEEAVQLIARQPAIMELDALQVGDHYFMLNVSAGISARAMQKTEPEAKQRFGFGAYFWTIFNEILGFNPQYFNLLVDGHRMRVRATEILVSNVKLMEEPPNPLGPPEQFADGKLDVYIVTARTFGDYLRVAWDLLQKPDQRKKDIRHLTANKSVRIEAIGTPQPTQADGEVLDKTPVEIKVAGDAFKVIVPEEAVMKVEV